MWVTAGWSPTGAGARGSGHASAAGSASRSAAAGAPESFWAGSPDAGGSPDGRPAQAPGLPQSEAFAVHARSHAADTQHLECGRGGGAAPRFRSDAPAEDTGGVGPSQAPERARAGAASAGGGAGEAARAGDKRWEREEGRAAAGAGGDAGFGAPAGPGPAGGALNAGQRWWRGGASVDALEEAAAQEEAAWSHPGAVRAAEGGAGRPEGLQWRTRARRGSRGPMRGRPGRSSAAWRCRSRRPRAPRRSRSTRPRCAVSPACPRGGAPTHPAARRASQGKWRSALRRHARLGLAIEAEAGGVMGDCFSRMPACERERTCHFVSVLEARACRTTAGARGPPAVSRRACPGRP
jgi:hypothetical protein